MCVTKGGALLSMMNLSIEEQKTVPFNDENSIEPKKVTRNNATSMDKLDSTSSTQSCSEEFSVSEAEAPSLQHRRRRPSAILRNVRDKLTKGKSESSDLDTSHSGRTFDFLEGLEGDADGKASRSDADYKAKLDDVTSPTNDTTDVDAQQGEDRPSLILRVRGKLSRRKSDSSDLDTSHSGRKLDFLEGREEDVADSDSLLDDEEKLHDVSSPTNDTAKQGEGRPSLILRKVGGRLARRKSESSLLDTSHNGRKLDFLEGLEGDVDSSSSDSLSDEKEKLDDDSSPSNDSTDVDVHQEECRHAPSPEKPSLHRIMSTPAVMQNTSRSARRPSSCLRNSSFNSTSVQSLPSNNSSVHFGTINIREYQRSLVDNPAVTDGPPIGLSWDYDPQECKFDVDEYEDLRPTPRKREEFCIPPRVREDMLVHEWGHTLHDVRRASQEAKEIRLLRERTQHMSKQSEQVCELVESSMRKWQRLKTRTVKG